jgi:hypothetical protein
MGIPVGELSSRAEPAIFVSIIIFVIGWDSQLAFLELTDCNGFDSLRSQKS